MPEAFCHLRLLHCILLSIMPTARDLSVGAVKSSKYCYISSVAFKKKRRQDRHMYVGMFVCTYVCVCIHVCCYPNQFKYFIGCPQNTITFV